MHGTLGVLKGDSRRFQSEAECCFFTGRVDHFCRLGKFGVKMNPAIPSSWAEVLFFSKPGPDLKKVDLAYLGV